MSGLFLLWFMGSLGFAAEVSPIRVREGFVTRVSCQGRLLAAATGNTRLLLVEPVPREMGCAVLLKTGERTGKTDLLLETSTGTIHRIVDIFSGDGKSVSVPDLEFHASGEDR